MSVEFAPLNIPLERRLQTLSVVAYVGLITLGRLCVLIFSTYLFFYTTYLRLIYFAYLTWIYGFDRTTSVKGSRPSNWVRSWRWWQYLAKYFPVKLTKLPHVELDPKKNYLFCCFPHGMVATGAFIAFLTDGVGVSKIFPNHKSFMHTLHANLLIPITRELLMRLGAISASAESLNYILSRPEGGNVSALVVGGAQEAYYSRPGHYKLVLKNRKGFVKIALKNGSPLVPVMSFGEPDILAQKEFEKGSRLHNFQLMVKECCGFVPIVPIGRGIFQYTYGIIPQREAINVVVGEPINVDKVDKPTQEQIDTLHAEFIEKLTELFESQKKNYLKNYEDIHLEIL